MKKRIIRSLMGVASAGFISAPAYAGMPVFDAMNFASNVISNFQLAAIKHQLQSKDEGTVVYNTQNIDNSTKNIDESTKNIDKSTHNIENITNLNYDIDVNFKWIIKKGGDEIIPIPRKVKDKLAAVVGGASEGSFDGYASQYKDAEHYVGDKTEDLGSLAFEGSRARKAANDMLLKSVQQEQESLDEESESLKSMAQMINETKGHGHQLQVANALSGSQINQLMKLRNAMMVADAHRVAEAQASADKEARSIAVAARMREGLDARLNGSKPLASAP